MLVGNLDHWKADVMAVKAVKMAVKMAELMVWTLADLTALKLAE